MKMEGDEHVQPDDILNALTRILKSGQFVRSKRLSQYLTWLVNRTLNGASAGITEHSIAFDVYERGHAFDPQVDGTVRVETYRLRRKLQDYYEGPGREDPIRII